jgi:hypothetical protein
MILIALHILYNKTRFYENEVFVFLTQEFNGTLCPINNITLMGNRSYSVTVDK